MSTFRSSILGLMPPQLYERVGKWTHEPRSNFNHMKPLSNAFTFTFFQHHFILKIQKYIYFLAYTTKTQKHHYRIIFTLLHCYLLFVLHIIFYFTYIYTLCLTTTRWSWGHRIRKLFCKLLEEEQQDLFRLFPESSILNPEFSRGNNLLLLQHSALGVPTSWHLS
jgi:hypothetical protein